MAAWKIELWPGYVTSIRQHEHKLLLCCEPKFKVVRTDTVHQQMQLALRFEFSDVRREIPSTQNHFI